MSLSRSLVLGALVAILPGSAWAQPVTVSHQAGLLSIQCSNAPLSSVFEAIEREAGIELTLEDAIKSKRLSADLSAVPVSMAVQRLLEGAGVNYIVMMDPSDWGRVGKIFVGGGGGGPARSAGPAPRTPFRPEPEPVEEEFYDDYDAMDPNDPALAGFEDPNLLDGLEVPEEFVDPNDPGAFENQPGSSPIPNFFPPSQSYPRSNFTPGLPNQPQPYLGPGAQQQQQQQQQAPPATFPFMDPFGRPIPVPPGMTQQQQQEQQQQQRRRQQQQQ